MVPLPDHIFSLRSPSLQVRGTPFRNFPPWLFSHSYQRNGTGNRFRGTAGNNRKHPLRQSSGALAIAFGAGSASISSSACASSGSAAPSGIRSALLANLAAEAWVTLSEGTKAAGAPPDARKRRCAGVLPHAGEADHAPRDYPRPPYRDRR